MCTKPYDLRVKGETIAVWDHTLKINEDLEHVFSTNTMILFEILDFNPKLLVEKSNLLNSENFLPVAWGYLKPLGTSHPHTSLSKL
jgi:hypothetical protein